MRLWSPDIQSQYVILLLLILVSLVSGEPSVSAQSAWTQSSLLNDRSVLQNNPDSIGSKIGAIDNSNSGQLLKNLIGSTNSGFEPMQNGQIWKSTAGGSSTYFAAPDISDADLPLTASTTPAPVLPAPASSHAVETDSTTKSDSSQPVIDCASGFASSGACGISVHGGEAAFWNPNYVSGSQSPLVPAGCTHCGNGFNYQTPVNVQAFTATFTFVPNGWNIAFVLQNNTNHEASGGACSGTACTFAAGAGCEAGFYQAFDPATPPYPNNIFALELDQQSDLVNDNGAGYGSPFTYSNVQIYHAGQSPCNPNDYQPDYTYTPKISTSPVSLNSPPDAVGTTTGHTYSVTLNYDGSTLVMNMYDVTAGGSCPGASCFTHTWRGVNIPSLVGRNTAYLGITGGTNEASKHPLYVKSLVYNDNGVHENDASSVATPTFSPVAGTYANSQSVTISDASSGATIYYTTNGTTPSTSSSVYSGRIKVGATENLKAIAVESGYTNSAVASTTYTISAKAGTSVIDFPAGFADSTRHVTLNGSAQLSGSLLELTSLSTNKSGAAWYDRPVNVQSFTTNFTFQLTSPSADGFTFTIQNNNDTVEGASGENLGYGTITNSVAVKFDLYNNSGEGTDSTGLYTDGTRPTVPAIDMTSSGVNLHSGDTMAVMIVYNGTTLTMTITDTVTNATFSNSWTIDIPGTLGADTAYVGFTGGTGGYTAIQDILTWTYSN
jgi:hypothetical protein